MRLRAYIYDRRGARCSIQTSLISINHKTESMKDRAMKLQKIKEKLIDFILLTLVHLYTRPIVGINNIQSVLKFLKCFC